MKEIKLSKKVNICFNAGIYFVTENGDFGITFDSMGFNIKRGFLTYCYYWFWKK